MTTAQLVALLASEAKPIRPESYSRKLAFAVLVGAAISLACALAVSFLIGPGSLITSPAAFAMKGLYSMAIALPALISLSAHCRPGSQHMSFKLPVFSALLVLAIAASVDRFRRPDETWADAIVGRALGECALALVALSVPVFISLLIVVRRQAPTLLRTTGALIGTIAGAIASAIYSMFCLEGSPFYVLVWHTLGIILLADLGWSAGPRLLRW